MKSTEVKNSPIGKRFPLLALLGQLAKTMDNRSTGRRRLFSRKVEKQIELLLGHQDVQSENVARKLGCSRQTLYRRLKAENVTYGQLLDRVRSRLASRLFRDGHSVKEVAYRLGFSDPSAFSRAFKRWTGSSPRNVRD